MEKRFPYKLTSSKKLPAGYQLMTVEEVLDGSVEVTKFLAYDSLGFERAERHVQETNGYKLKSMGEVVSSNFNEIDEEEDKQGLQEMESPLQDLKTTTNFLVYQEDENESSAGILKITFHKEDNLKDKPNLCDFQLETVLQRGSKEKKAITFLVNKKNGFEHNGVLEVEFEKVVIHDEEDDDYDDDDDDDDIDDYDDDDIDDDDDDINDYDDDDIEDEDNEEEGEEEEKKEEQTEEYALLAQNKDKEDNKLQDDKNATLHFSRTVIHKEIPDGYRLSTLEELLTCAGYAIKFLVKKSKLSLEGSPSPGTYIDTWLMLRRSDVLKAGEDRDIQDFCGTYFSYEKVPYYDHPKIRLKNGFIDKSKRLVWKEFTKHSVYQQLGVRSTYIETCDDQLNEEDQVVALLFSCGFGFYNEVEELLKSPNYFEIMSKNNKNAPREGSAIHLAAAEGMLKCLEIFWKKLNTEEKTMACKLRANWDGETPLHLAVLMGHKKIVKMLCMSGSINQVTDEDRLTALMLATQYQMEDQRLWKPILECKGLKLDTQNQRKNNIFHMVSYYEGVNFNENSFATLLKELLEKCGCKVSRKAYKAAGSKLLADDVKEVAELYRENCEHTKLITNDSNCINHKNDKLSTPLHKSLGLRDISTSRADEDDEDMDDQITHLPPCQPIPIQFSRLLISAGADIHATDMQGQNALHRACMLPRDSCTIQILFRCFLGNHLDTSKECQDAKKEWSMYVCSQDFYGQTPLHLAAKSGNHEAVCFFLNETYNTLADKLIEMRDFDERTILHFVATPSDRFTVEEMIKEKIAKEIFNITSKSKYSVLPLLIWSVAERVGLADELAKNKNYDNLAKILKLKRESFTENLLGLALSTKKYDMAVELINRGAIITKQMQDNAKIEDLLQKELKFLNQNVNSANNRRHLDFDDDHTCAELRNNCLISLYKNRKAQVEQKINEWRKSLDQPNRNQLNVLDKIKSSHRGRTTDQPTSEDLLGRRDIKSSISALLLNQHMGSPITLGILGGTGMGKSSMMLQVEHNLLSKAARQTLSLALRRNYSKPKIANIFTGARKEPTRSKRHAKELLNELRTVIKKIENKRKEKVNDFDEAIDLTELKEIEKKRSKQRIWGLALDYIFAVFIRVKSLVFSKITDKDLPIETIEDKINNYISKYSAKNMWLLKRLALANDGKEVPALMTVRYNAWQYETKDEAWAGLAVAILKEMESCMTKEQLLYASVMYSFKKNPSQTRINLVLPIIVYMVLGVVVGWISFRLLSIPKKHNTKVLRYGSVVLSIFLSIWKVLSTVSSYVKPISEKFIETTQSLQVQHLARIGYQHRVIEDITFLRDQMCEDISIVLLWRIVAIILNISSGSKFSAEKQEETDALKYKPPRENFRITVFIDNLDRNKEKLYTPLNMILKSCDINAVVAIDKDSVEDVIVQTNDQLEEETQNQSITQDQSINKLSHKDTLLQQLIQIPIVLPEPDVFELTTTFLEHHLKDMQNTKTNETKSPTSNRQTTGPLLQSQDANFQEEPTTPSITILNSDEIEGDNNDQNTINNTLTREGKRDLTKSYGVTTKMEEQSRPRQVTCYSVDIHLSKYSQQNTNTNTRVEENLLQIQAHEEKKQEEEEDNNEENTWLEAKVNVLDSNYSRGEIEIFKHLAKHTYGYYRSPRAWKSLLNYHRLIRSLMTYNNQYTEIKAWKRQLIIWVFLCWQWRKQMNEIFQNWESLSYFSLEQIKYDTILVDEQNKAKLLKALKSDFQIQFLKKKGYAHLWDSINTIYPTLSEIVGKQKDKQKEIDEGSQNNSSSSKQKQREAKSNKEGDALHWDRLSKALEAGRFDVTMQAIQAFQKYRFDCEVSSLRMVVSGNDS